MNGWLYVWHSSILYIILFFFKTKAILINKNKTYEIITDDEELKK